MSRTKRREPQEPRERAMAAPWKLLIWDDFRFVCNSHGYARGRCCRRARTLPETTDPFDSYA